VLGSVVPETGVLDVFKAFSYVPKEFCVVEVRFK
jgi:hypothetical protein